MFYCFTVSTWYTVFLLLLVYLATFFIVISLTLGQSYDYHDACNITPKDMIEIDHYVTRTKHKRVNHIHDSWNVGVLGCLHLVKSFHIGHNRPMALINAYFMFKTWHKIISALVALFEWNPAMTFHRHQWCRSMDTAILVCCHETGDKWKQNTEE